MRRRKNKKQIKIIIFSAVCLLLIMTVGYAAFSTNITLNAKGNIITTPNECFTVSDNGDGTGSIENYDINCGKTVKIPSEINDLTITKIGDGILVDEKSSGPFTHSRIERVILPDTMVEIGYIAFFGSSLKSINFPNSLRKIGAQAFAFSLLSEAKLNEGLETINQEAFTNTYITNLKIPSSVKNMNIAVATSNLMEGENAFIYAKDVDGNVDMSTLNSFGNRNAENIIFPENIKKLGILSIYNMNNVTALNIPDTVEELDNKFMYRMPNLETINIGRGIKTIHQTAFSGASSMPSLKVININRKKDAISGAPWGATGVTVNWTGTN